MLLCCVSEQGMKDPRRAHESSFWVLLRVLCGDSFLACHRTDDSERELQRRPAIIAIDSGVAAVGNSI